MPYAKKNCDTCGNPFQPRRSGSASREQRTRCAPCRKNARGVRAMLPPQYSTPLGSRIEAVPPGTIHAIDPKVLQLSETVERLTRQLDWAHSERDSARTERDRARKAEIDALRVREQAFGLHPQAPVAVPEWALTQHKGSGLPHVPVLVTSDFQWGERIAADNMDGVNGYDIETAEVRYRTLIDRTIDIARNHLPANRYDGMIYLRLGDAISGEIHADLRESNVMQAIPATRSLVAAESWGIDQLAREFGRVHVISVPGNHGRTTLKPQAKRGGADNFDTLSAWWLESIFAGRKDEVTFQTPDSIDALFALHGRRYLATHGDRIGSRGGEGFIGPAATIMRGMKRTADLYAKLGKPIDKMFIGHFHTAYDLGYGWCNGSLPGYSEYARDGRMTPEPPLQWLIFMHPRYGATSQWKILVDAEPRATTEQAVDFAPRF